MDSLLIAHNVAERESCRHYTTGFGRQPLPGLGGASGAISLKAPDEELLVFPELGLWAKRYINRPILKHPPSGGHCVSKLADVAPTRCAYTICELAPGVSGRLAGTTLRHVPSNRRTLGIDALTPRSGSLSSVAQCGALLVSTHDSVDAVGTTLHPGSSQTGLGSDCDLIRAVGMAVSLSGDRHGGNVMVHWQTTYAWDVSGSIQMGISVWLKHEQATPLFRFGFQETIDHVT